MLFTAVIKTTGGINRKYNAESKKKPSEKSRSHFVQLTHHEGIGYWQIARILYCLHAAIQVPIGQINMNACQHLSQDHAQQ